MRRSVLKIIHGCKTRDIPLAVNLADVIKFCFRDAESGRHEAAHDVQGGKAKKTMPGTSTPTSYAGAVKASNRKLTITRK